MWCAVIKNHPQGNGTNKMCNIDLRFVAEHKFYICFFLLICLPLLFILRGPSLIVANCLGQFFLLNFHNLEKIMKSQNYQVVWKLFIFDKLVLSFFVFNVCLNEISQLSILKCANNRKSCRALNSWWLNIHLLGHFEHLKTT